MELLASHDDIYELGLHRHPEVALPLAHLRRHPSSLVLASHRSSLELFRVASELRDNPVHRMLEFSSALNITIEHADAEWLQFVDHLFAQNAKRLGCLRGDQNAPAFSE